MYIKVYEVYWDIWDKSYFLPLVPSPSALPSPLHSPLSLSPSLSPALLTFLLPPVAPSLSPLPLLSSLSLLPWFD